MVQDTFSRSSFKACAAVTFLHCQETEWVDGKSYKMGDGFMTYTDEGAKADTRRVAVMHSKNATSNRIGIGMVSGVFDALTSAIASGTPDTRSV